MERLTHKMPNGVVVPTQLNLDFVFDMSDQEFAELQKIFDRLADIEDILGDEYDLDHLLELVEAERDGRLTIHPAPAKEGDPQPSCFDGEGASIWCRNYVCEDGGDPTDRCKRCWYCEDGDYADDRAEAKAAQKEGGEHEW